MGELIWLEAVTLALAAARLTRLIVTDTFPPIAKARNWILMRWPSEDTAFGDSELGFEQKTRGTLLSGVEVFKHEDAWYATKPHTWSELVSCVWCAGFWVSLLVWVAWWFYPVTAVLLAPFALSQIAGWLNDRN